MLVSSLYQHLPRVLVLPLLLLGLSACQPVAPKKASSHPGTITLNKQQPAQPGSTEPNFACSYYYFLRGRNAELQLQFKDALGAYEEAFKCDNKASYVQDKIPMLLLRLDRAEEAAQWLAQYLQENPDNVSMRMLYARILLGQQNTDAAMQQYRRILENHPDDPAVILPLAEMQLASGHTDQARTILSKTLQRDPQSYQAHVLMARLLRSENRVEEAKAHYGQALALNWSADLQSEEAELLVQEKDYEQAEAMYRDIIDREEQNETAYLGLIRLLLQQDKDEMALQELHNLRQVVDKPLWVDMSIARLYIKQEKNQEARNLLEQMLNRDNNSEARLLLAVLLQREKHYEEALRQVRLIDNKELEYPQALTLMIALYKELNRVDDAVLVLERNIASPITRHPAMYPLLATLHDSQGRSIMSRKVYEQGIASYPRDEDLLYTYGIFLEEKGYHRDALATMEKLVAINPQNAGALNFVGYSWAEKGINLEKALGYLLRASRLKPENGYIRDSLGWVLYKLGRMDEAARELEQASQQAQDDPAILEHLAEVYLAAGKRDPALIVYKQLLRQYIDAHNETARQNVLDKIYSIEQGSKP